VFEEIAGENHIEGFIREGPWLGTILRDQLDAVSEMLGAVWVQVHSVAGLRAYRVDKLTPTTAHVEYDRSGIHVLLKEVFTENSPESSAVFGRFGEA
jgi:hypothetical protein